MSNKILRILAFVLQKLFDGVRKLSRYARYFSNNKFIIPLIYYTTLSLWITSDGKTKNPLYGDFL